MLSKQSTTDWAVCQSNATFYWIDVGRSPLFQQGLDEVHSNPKNPKASFICASVLGTSFSFPSTDTCRDQPQTLFGFPLSSRLGWSLTKQSSHWFSWFCFTTGRFLQTTSHVLMCLSTLPWLPCVLTTVDAIDMAASPSLVALSLLTSTAWDSEPHTDKWVWGDVFCPLREGRPFCCRCATTTVLLPSHFLPVFSSILPLLLFFSHKNTKRCNVYLLPFEMCSSLPVILRSPTPAISAKLNVSRQFPCRKCFLHRRKPGSEIVSLLIYLFLLSMPWRFACITMWGCQILEL